VRAMAPASLTSRQADFSEGSRDILSSCRRPLYAIEKAPDDVAYHSVKSDKHQTRKSTEVVTVFSHATLLNGDIFTCHTSLKALFKDSLLLLI
jgi:hypothetical protein